MSGNRQLTHEHDNSDEEAVKMIKQGTRITKSGILSEEGYSGTRFEINNIEIEARGPNVSIESEASLDKVTSMARVEYGSVSPKAGPVKVKAGIGFDTGASAGLDGVEAKFLGTGFSIGRKMGISLFGSEISFTTR